MARNRTEININRSALFFSLDIPHSMRHHQHPQPKRFMSNITPKRSTLHEMNQGASLFLIPIMKVPLSRTLGARKRSSFALAALSDPGGQAVLGPLLYTFILLYTGMMYNSDEPFVKRCSQVGGVIPFSITLFTKTFTDSNLKHIFLWLDLDARLKERLMPSVRPSRTECPRQH